MWYFHNARHLFSCILHIIQEKGRPNTLPLRTSFTLLRALEEALSAYLPCYADGEIFITVTFHSARSE